MTKLSVFNIQGYSLEKASLADMYNYAEKQVWRLFVKNQGLDLECEI